MTAKKTSKIAAWGAGGATGLIGVTNIAVTVTQHSSGHGVPLGMWLLLVATVMATTFLTAVTMILRYLEGEPYRSLLTATARKPECSANFAEVIDADSRHEAVENGGILTDKQQEKLYRPRKEAPLPPGPQPPPG